MSLLPLPGIFDSNSTLSSETKVWIQKICGHRMLWLKNIEHRGPNSWVQFILPSSDPEAS